MKIFGVGSPSVSARTNPTNPRTGPDAAASARNPIPAGVAHRDEICRAARAHGIAPLLLAAQAAQESGGPGTNSGRNILERGGHGHGLFQLDPGGGFGPWLMTHHNGLDVRENAEMAATVDAKNLRTFGSTHAMLTVFNAGHDRDADSAVTVWPDGKHLHYAESVERHLQQLERLAGER